MFGKKNLLTLPLTTMRAVERFRFRLTLRCPCFHVSVVALSRSATLVLLASETSTNCKLPWFPRPCDVAGCPNCPRHLTKSSSSCESNALSWGWFLYAWAFTFCAKSSSAICRVLFYSNMSAKGRDGISIAAPPLGVADLNCTKGMRILQARFSLIWILFLVWNKHCEVSGRVF